MTSSIQDIVDKYEVPPERLTLEEKMQIMKVHFLLLGTFF